MITRPNVKLSVIVPCFNIESHIDELFISLEAQDVSPSLVEIIFINDGSIDGTPEKISSFASRSQFSVKQINQSNRGVAGARNAGLLASTGEFITFVDGDDSISPNYFSALIEAIDEHPNLHMFTTQLIRTDAQGKTIPHPLDYKFAGAEDPQTIDLRLTPEMIHLHATVALRRTLIAEYSLKFDENLRQGFEDAHFFARYLLSLDSPTYLLIPHAHYFYQKREDSVIATANHDRSKFTYLVTHAYPELLSIAGNQCPGWLANLILYDLYWLFRDYYRMQGAVFALNDEIQNLLHTEIRLLIQKIGLSNIRSFRIVNIPFDLRASWEGVFGAEYVTPMYLLHEFDPISRQQKIVSYSTEPVLDTPLFIERYKIHTVASKAREVLFFDRVWIYEHIFWVQLDRNPTKYHEIKVKQSDTAFLNVTNEKVMRLKLDISPPIPPKRQSHASVNRSGMIKAKLKSSMERFQFSFAYRMSRLSGTYKRYRDAWVLIDRDFQANDNAEALYRELYSNRPDINSWFVINKDSADYQRLKDLGYRLVAHGSKKHFLLMKNAKVLLSSMVDQYIVQPFPRKYLSKSWMYVFLQHGVTKDRIHRWLNGKDIDLLVTSTRAEYDSIVCSPSPYKLSSREVALTGMPRHDRLTALSNDSNETSTTIMIMPTWRNYLLGPATGGSRKVLDGFYESDFVTKWSELLNSQDLLRLHTDANAEIILLPHPGIDEHWASLKLPSYISRISYASDDIQKYLSRTTVAITDYSSQAFEAAYCGAPTVYFQFDRTKFFSGSHIASPGYFDYDTDGFGPVCSTVDQVAENTRLLVEGIHPEQHLYRERIASLYEFKDGNACSRIISEVESRLRQPISAVG